MMNYFYPIVLFFFISSYGFSQEIIRSHFGAFAAHSTQNVHWNAGELSSGLKSGDSNFITAGFIQPNIYINTSSRDAVKQKIELTAWPNPTYDVVRIKLEKAKSLTCLLMTTQGKILERKNIHAMKFTMNMSAYPPATYVLQLQDSKGITSVLRIVKIN